MRIRRGLPPTWLVCAIGFLCVLLSGFYRAKHTTIVIQTPIVDNPKPNNQPARLVVPVPLGNRPVIEMTFVIDTTGSMGGLIEAAKMKVWSIINTVMQSPSHPRVRVGLVAYRDHGDDYVTKVLPITEDLDSVYSTLMDYQARGGGDIPEDVRQALSDGVRKAGWSQRSTGMAQMIFLVGDAPPHNDYTNEPDCLTTTAEATQRGITVNTIECGNAVDTRQAWQEIAQHGQGQFLKISQDGGVQTISTPYDEELSKLGAAMGRTYVAYGSATGGGTGGGASGRVYLMTRQAELEGKFAAKASAPASADRAVNKAINSAAYRNDLLEDVAHGVVTTDGLKSEDLPDDLRKLAPAERKAEVDKRIAERKAKQTQILDLAKKRDAFIADAKKNGGKSDGFDAAVIESIKKQAATNGIKL